MRTVPPALARRVQALLDAGNASVILAIDGPCGGGKSTLAEALHAQFPDSLLIHADDFFLQPHQRTAQRLSEPGGNLDRERLQAEVLEPVKAGSYQGHRRFNCQSGQMEDVPGSMRPLIIIEGSYSHHPALRPWYDLTVFLDISGEDQLDRLRRRCDEAALQRFVAEWIPLENAYFRHFDIRAQADLLLMAGQAPPHTAT